VEHSCYAIFHPYQYVDDMCWADGWINVMALAISDFGEYVLKENLTARFPKNGLNLNHIP